MEHNELRSWTASEIEEYDDARLELAEDGKIDCTRVYIKEEADAVIKELELIKFKYEFGKHFDQIHSFLFDLDFWEITELIGEEFDKKISFKSKNGCFILNCTLIDDSEIYKMQRLSETDYFVECGFDKIFSELAKLEK